MNVRWWNQFLVVGVVVVAPLLNQSIAKDVRVLRYQDKSKSEFSNMGGDYERTLPSPRVVTSFTLCYRVRLLVLYGRTSFINLSSKKDGNLFVIRPEFWIDRMRIVIAGLWIMMPMKSEIGVLRWHHMCFTYDHEAKEVTSYLDGRPEKRIEIEVDKAIRVDFIWMGRRIKGLFLDFVGDMTQLNMWSRAMSVEEIQGLASCNGDPQGDFLSWEEDLQPENVIQYTIPLDQLCPSESSSFYFWFTWVTFSTAQYLCEALGSYLPLPSTVEEIDVIRAESVQRWPNASDRPRDFWTPLNDREQEGVWRSVRDPLAANLTLPWSRGEPNGLHYENCAYISQHLLNDVHCINEEAAAACKFEEPSVFTLLGTCETEKETVTFLAKQEDIDHLVFEGIGKSQILKENETWIWIDTTSNSTFGRLEDIDPNFPMGRRWWVLAEGVCSEDSEDRRQLLLTTCPEKHFTCDDATCVLLEYRCDRKYDCRDRSDENDCQFIVFPEDYTRDISPKARGISKDSVLITLDFRIETVVVETESMKMTLSFVFAMIWSDERLNYQNLKVKESENEVPLSIVRSLWTPLVRFMNTDGNHHTEVDHFTTTHVKRVCDPVGMNESAPAEVEVYGGDCNTLNIKRRYNLNFMCNFDLLLYPFDEQFCNAHVRIISASKTFLKFHPKLSTAEYTGNPSLLEYEVGGVSLRHDDSGAFSEAYVKVPLTRLYGYAMLNIFLPSILLLVISYVTLFFSKEVFETRMMASLTNLLVMATLFTQTSASLPKTSYFKMVDVWLLMCIALIFLVVILHALIDYNLRLLDLPGENQLFRVRPMGQKISPPKNARKVTVERLVLASRIILPVVFVIFTVCYALYIRKS
ncbi:uncharacterized protein [Panulirus ornatus]|uniref:uncharacterized protein n=1 Tax=Panulirus ornatus TaxID=150431 RepID=UPI003A88F937